MAETTAYICFTVATPSDSFSATTTTTTLFIQTPLNDTQVCYIHHALHLQSELILLQSYSIDVLPIQDTLDDNVTYMISIRTPLLHATPASPPATPVPASIGHPAHAERTP